VPVTRVLKTLLNLDSFVDKIEFTHEHLPGHYSSFQDGKYYRESGFATVEKSRFHFILSGPNTCELTWLIDMYLVCKYSVTHWYIVFTAVICV